MANGELNGISLPKVDLREVEEWKKEPSTSFDQRASLEIARYVLAIFGGVLVMAFITLGAYSLKDGATFEHMIEVLKFLVNSALPLVTLAVGYYLGDRNSGLRPE